MKIKNVWMALATMAVVFTSCNKEDGDNPGVGEGETRSVRIQLLQNGGTRAEGNEVNNTAISLSDGFIYFADNDLITKKVVLSSTATTSPNGDVINVADLDGVNGVRVFDVPSHSTQIFLVSNMPASATGDFSVSTPVATLKSLAISASDINLTVFNGNTVPAWGVESIPLFGTGTVTPDPQDPELASAHITVGAIASRIEIEQIEFTAGSAVSDFSVLGVYINHFYPSTTLDGRLVNGVSLINYTETSDYQPNTGVYQTNGVFFDSYAPTGLPLGFGQASSPNGVSPDVGVWSYNLLPCLQAGAEAVPHIVIVIDDVEVGGVPLNGEKYLTVKGLRDTNGEIVNIQPGNIYHIESITFTEDNITTEPETEAFDVDVTVTLTPWVINNVDVVW